MASGSTSALVRLWPFARRQWAGLAFSVATAYGMMLAGLTIPIITGRVIDELDAKRSDELWWLAGMVVLMGLLEAVLAFARRYSAARASLAIEEDMRNTLYGHLQALPVSFHDGWQSGQLLSRVMSDLSVIRRFIGFGSIFLLLNISHAIFAIGLMFRIDGRLAMMTVITSVPVVLLSTQFNRRYRTISRRVQDDQGDLTTLIEESATGIRIVKAFGRGPMMASRFEKEADKLHGSNMEATYLRGFFVTMLRLLPALNLSGVVLIGGSAVLHQSMTKGDLAEFITLLLMLQWPIRSLGWLLANAEESRTAAERVFEVLDTVPEITDRPDARPLPTATGQITFENVSFTYPGQGEPILRNINLTIEPGETVAIIGMTGSGKTTLASLVPRLLDATEGRVLLDGHDIRDLTLSSLRSHMGVAFEDPQLFSMSVRENLLLGRPHSTEEDVQEAIDTANARFVDELPWGLDTRVGEQGYSLSGGQRQRLALARAVLGRPQVLMLDDPLSAVDVHTEALIEAALERVLSGVTALLVVHRPSTIALADRVALLHEGTIMATGTHSELMETEPIYRSILSQEAELAEEQVTR